MFGLIISLVVAGIAGWLAGNIMKAQPIVIGNSPIIGNVVLGIIGGFVGNADRRRLTQLRTLDPAALARESPPAFAGAGSLPQGERVLRARWHGKAPGCAGFRAGSGKVHFLPPAATAGRVLPGVPFALVSHGNTGKR